MALRVLYIFVISSLATMPPRDVIARRGTAFSREIAMGLTALAMEKGVGNVLWGGRLLPPGGGNLLAVGVDDLSVDPVQCFTGAEIRPAAGLCPGIDIGIICAAGEG